MIYPNRNAFMAAAAALILAACDGNLPSLPSGSPSGNGEVSTNLRGTKLFVLPACNFSAPSTSDGESFGALLAGVGANLAASATKKAIDLAIAAAVARGEDEEASLSARGKGMFHLASGGGSASLNFGCLVFVDGRFGPSKEGAFAGSVYSEPSKEFIVKTLGLSSPPNILIEMPIALSDDRTAFAPELGYIYYGDRITSGSSGDRSILFSISFKDGLSNDEDKSFANFAMTLQGVRPILEYTELSPGPITDKWAPVPTISNDAVEGPASPFGVTVTITETRKGSKFWKFVGEVLNENSEDIKEEASAVVVNIISPKKESEE